MNNGELRKFAIIDFRTLVYSSKTLQQDLKPKLKPSDTRQKQWHKNKKPLIWVQVVFMSDS